MVTIHAKFKEKNWECVLSPIKASAPGSLMLMGEHAVLYGHKALVFAINKRISATLSSISKPLISIRSQLGNYEISFDEFEALISKKLKSEKIFKNFLLSLDL